MDGAPGGCVRAFLVFACLIGVDGFGAVPPDCRVLLVSPPKNPVVVDYVASIVSEHSTGRKEIAIGSLQEMKLMMRALGHSEKSIESNSKTISGLFGMVIIGRQLTGTALERTVRRLYSDLGDSNKLHLCLLGKNCTFGIGRDAHVFVSQTVNMRPTDESKHGSQVIQKDGDNPAPEITDPLHVIVIHYRNLVSGNIIFTFFHEGSHYDVSSILFDWIKRHESEFEMAQQKDFSNI